MKNLLFIFVFCLLSCVQTQESAEISPTTDTVDPVLPEEIDQVIDFVDHDSENKVSIGSADEGNEEDIEKIEGAIPVEVNKRVQKWIVYFTKKHPRSFQRYLDRGAQYRPLIERVLRDQGLPLELYYLAMIESGFNTRATSRAKAVGVWQFMKGTARRYGLAVNYYVDERRDPVRATIAASLYLSDLNNVFQSWYLTMAAYNAGESRIMNAIMNGKSRDFWSLASSRKLPRETMNYIPKFMAAMIIGSNPEKYGLRNPEIPAGHDPAPFQVSSPITLSGVAKVSGVSISKLRKLNPHLKRGVTPPNQRKYKLWVPRRVAAKLAAKSEALKAHIVKLKIGNQQHSAGIYKVRSGDTLGGVSKRYGIKIRELKSINGLRSSRIYPGQKLLLAEVGSPKQVTKNSGSRYYRVRSGDTLAKISNRYGVSVSRLKSINGLNSSRIYRGQRLNVKSRVVSYRRYRVRSGDNLNTIAKRFGTTVSYLRSINRLRRDRIYVGQLLKVGARKG